jgi:hypothetical protein
VVKIIAVKKNILAMTPMRFFDLWKINGEPPFGLITVGGFTGAFELDEITSFIWLHLDGSHTVNDIITKICNRFSDVKRDEVEKDVCDILKRMDTDDIIILDYNPLCPYKNLKTFKKLKKRKSNDKTTKN